MYQSTQPAPDPRSAVWRSLPIKARLPRTSVGTVSWLPRVLLVAGLAVAALCNAAVLATADPAQWVTEGWRTDFSRATVDLGEVIDGGVRRDGIPPLDDPTFTPVAQMAELPGREPVMAFVHKGEARAYPLRVMTWHEIVNDEIGGDPVAITYCPLCNAAIVFDRRVGDAVLSFGTTGKLRHSDLIMYDRATDSWWQQFSGEAIAGTYAGEALTMLPSQLMSFDQFAARHPDGRVLDTPTGFRRPYGRNPYRRYDTAAAPFLYQGPFPQGIAPLARVVLVRGLSEPFAVAVDRIAVDERFEHAGVTLTFEAGQASALDAEIMAEARDVGTIHVMMDGEPVLHDVTFAFVVHAFMPGLEIIQ